MDSAQFAQQTILFIDDNEDDIFIMKAAFKKAGVTNLIQTCSDGEGAIAYLQGAGPYCDRLRYPLPVVAFLDLNMPRQNGLEVLHWIRQESPVRWLTVHILTASSRDADVKEAFARGANSYFIKPSRMEDLLELVKAWHCAAQFSQFYPSN